MNSHWNSEIDASFHPDKAALDVALDALLDANIDASRPAFGDLLPEDGLGELKTLQTLAPIVIGGARRLGDDTAFAHMDPPTPWITWATTLWNAALNQNLLHPDVAPVARDIEDQLMQWLAPCFGMSGGHMTPGSTVANLTALWAARELRGIKTVVTSKTAHLSVAKSAHILGLQLVEVETNDRGQIEHRKLPADLSSAALVLTAGTTSSGSLDDLRRSNNAAWMHVDAAWAGPLQLSQTHRDKLAGIDAADSVAISGHKWFFQPKESGLVLFRDVEAAHEAVAFGGEYLAVPNIGVLGSRGANAIPLFATLLSWGRSGLAQRIDRAMQLADQLVTYLDSQAEVQLFGPNASGVVLWRPRSGIDVRGLFERLPVGCASITTINDKTWIRHVAANPNANMELLTDAIGDAIKSGK